MHTAYCLTVTVTVHIGLSNYLTPLLCVILSIFITSAFFVLTACAFFLITTGAFFLHTLLSPSLCWILHNQSQQIGLPLNQILQSIFGIPDQVMFRTIHLVGETADQKGFLDHIRVLV